nr:glycogen debranching enzyme [Geodermatophilaceae bacterium]
ILYGDEAGRSQGGNNNTYCQDNELTWIDWTAMAQDLVSFTAQLVALRRAHPVFRRRRFFDGRPVRRGQGEPLSDIVWLTPAGEEMTEEDWGSGFGQAVTVFVNGLGIQSTDTRGERITDDSFLLCFNGHDGPVDVTLPAEEYAKRWEVQVDTTLTTHENGYPGGATMPLPGRSLIVLRRTE